MLISKEMFNTIHKLLEFIIIDYLGLDSYG